MAENNIKEQFSALHKEIEYTAKKGLTLPPKGESLQGFLKDSWKSFKFILTEKENVFFALLQLGAIALGYYIWVQIIGWIPEEVWEEISDNDSAGLLINIVFLVWSFICVGLVAYPIGILTACMGASYTLHSEQQESTILKCLKIVLKRSWPLWIFSWFDGWLTVDRILDRLPKKKNRTPRAVKIFKELVYQAWKIATLGIIPALVYGRTVSDACKDSFGLLKNRFIELGKLRVAYSLICWIISILCYLSLIVFFPIIMKFQEAHNLSGIFAFYLFAGVPMIFALCFIMVVFRPLYIISSTRIYIDYAKEKQVECQFSQESSGGISAFIGYIVLIAIILIIILFKDQLGITNILQHNL